MNVFSFIQKLEKQFNKANFLQSLFLLAFRLSWGLQFFVTGKGKLINHADVTNFFASLHIPEPGFNAWLVGGAECIGGLLLMVGLFSRSTGLVLSTVMFTAYLAVDDDRAKVFHLFADPTPFLTADPFFFLLTAVLVLSFGPGVISLDHLMSVLAKRPQTIVTSPKSETRQPSAKA